MIGFNLKLNRKENVDAEVGRAFWRPLLRFSDRNEFLLWH
jgi:hypothetical protein